MIDLLHRFIIPAAYSVLPPAMASDRATALLLTIGLQESQLKHRKQIKGPARSFLQFERIGVAGVLANPRSRDPFLAAVDALCETPTIEGVHAAMTHNDVLTMCAGRCLLWQLPAALPGSLDFDGAYQQYVVAWRPGAARDHRAAESRARWTPNYVRAWQLVGEGIAR